jgi:DNA-binding HxlR family transcriptional regulator
MLVTCKSKVIRPMPKKPSFDRSPCPVAVTLDILADRLKRLEKYGVIEKKAYQDNPPRYEYGLTKKGLALGPVLKSIITWANDYIPGTMVPKIGAKRRRA